MGVAMLARVEAVVHIKGSDIQASLERAIAYCNLCGKDPHIDAHDMHM